MASTHEIKVLKYFDLLCLSSGNTVQSFNDYTQQLPPKKIHVFRSICAIAILVINAVRPLFLIFVDDPYWNIILGDFSNAVGVRRPLLTLFVITFCVSVSVRSTWLFGTRNRLLDFIYVLDKCHRGSHNRETNLRLDNGSFQRFKLHCTRSCCVCYAAYHTGIFCSTLCLGTFTYLES